MSAAQRDYVARALAENTKMRWTLVFMHKPLWDYEEETGWREIEALLKDRKHTVIAGHRHNYTKFERNDQSYIVLASTGGSSKMRGRAFGEFDQVAWVTMTDEGPIGGSGRAVCPSDRAATPETTPSVSAAAAIRAPRSTPFRTAPQYPKVSN